MAGRINFSDEYLKSYADAIKRLDSSGDNKVTVNEIAKNSSIFAEYSDLNSKAISIFQKYTQKDGNNEISAQEYAEALNSDEYNEILNECKARDISKDKNTVEKPPQFDLANSDHLIKEDQTDLSTYNFSIDGVIDSFAQGKVNDCWLLSGLKTLSASEQGRQFIKNAIKDNGDGTYTVTFKEYEYGYNKQDGFSCIITNDELTQARRAGIYSSGDPDVLLFELSMEKYFLEKTPNPEKFQRGEIIGAAGSTFIIRALTGYIKPEFRGLTPDKLFEYKYNDFKNGNLVLTCDFSNDVTVKDVSGKDISIISGHTYSIVDIYKDENDSTKNTVTIVNPWNSEEPIVLSWAEFSNIDVIIDSFCDDEKINVEDIFAPFKRGDISNDDLYGTLFNLACQGTFSNTQKEQILNISASLGLNIDHVREFLNACNDN